jgi:threonine dehydrogenase-like Zn-dependent dehydrogenase
MVSPDDREGKTDLIAWIGSIQASSLRPRSISDRPFWIGRLRMPSNTAAWFPAKYARLEVGPAPSTAPATHEIVVRNHAIAINPVDWAIPRLGGVGFGWIEPPTVLGSDVAGEVVEVGAEVSRFKVGDRVFGQALGASKARCVPDLHGARRSHGGADPGRDVL